MFHVVFVNPRPAEPLKDILLCDSWLSDRPSSEVFALTLKSSDVLEAMPREDGQYQKPIITADKEPADKRTEWSFDNGLDGWIAGCSENWDADAIWQSSGFGKPGVVVIPACNWAGNKFSWIEKKVTLPGWEKIEMQFLRHSAEYSGLAKQWTDGLLKVTVRHASGTETVYEKLHPSAGSGLRSGERSPAGEVLSEVEGWNTETVDLSRYNGQNVIIRFENHGAGTVSLAQNTSPACDAEDALIDDIQFIKK
jgi:hypothetical protein